MRKCKSCDADVLRTDAFCGTCGEPVPGVKPVVPITRDSGAGVMGGGPQNRGSGTYDQPAAAAAQAAAVVAISDPGEPRPPTPELTQTTIRERPQSEPAPVLPLRRKKASEERESTEQESTAKAVAPAVGDRDTSLSNTPVPPGPPILASELLREQMQPRTPGGRALRRVTVGLAAPGIVGVVVGGGVNPLTFASLGLLVGMLAGALSPLSYGARAVFLFLMGAAATGVASWQQTLQSLAQESAILAAATILLSGSLLFRAYYRGARLARVAVSMGVVALGAWFFLTGGHESLISLEGYWQSWVPATTHILFGLLALLALMAFMDSSTRGGVHWWAYSLLTLYVIHIGVLVASQVWPAPSGVPTLEAPAIAALIAGAVGTVVAGVSLAQVLVLAFQAARRDR